MREGEGEGRGAISRLIGFECIGIRVQGRGVHTSHRVMYWARVPRVPRSSNESRSGGQVLAIPR